MALNSPMKMAYFQDRYEFQARGIAHIHGTAWSNYAELEELNPGITLAFDKPHGLQQYAVPE